MSDPAVHSTSVPCSDTDTPSPSQGQPQEHSTETAHSGIEEDASQTAKSAADTTPSVAAASTPVDTLATSLSLLTVDSTATSTSDTTETTKVNDPKPTANAPEDQQEDLGPEEAALRAKGLKSTHRPGFYVHIDSPRRLRIQTKSKTFDLDRYCPHANADLLKWGVLRADMTLRCGVHYWGFDLVKNGQCIAHPDETLNACPVAELEW
ncbi:hypothetical protein EDD11_004793 [Mortierella claussenii]|nr:hypothetical protein EDD11_004793 [Mortierella claussenii]